MIEDVFFEILMSNAPHCRHLTIVDILRNQIVTLMDYRLAIAHSTDIRVVKE